MKKLVGYILIYITAFGLFLKEKWMLLLAGVFLAIGIAASALTVNAQTCPPDMVCLSRAAAQAALEAGDKAKALEVEVKAKEAAYAALKDVLENMRIEFARASGENTVLRQQQVADRALMTVLVQNTKKKRFGIINLF